jgi:hypothetical protein
VARDRVDELAQVRQALGAARARVDLLFKVALALGVFPVMLAFGVHVVPTPLSILGTFAGALVVLLAARTRRDEKRLALTHRRLMSESGGWRTGLR